MRPAIAPLLAILAASCLLPAAPAAAQQHDPFAPVYVVSSRATFDGSLRPLVRDAELRHDAAGRQVVISKVQSHRLEDLSRLVHEHERRCGGYFAFPTLAEARAFVRNDRSIQAARAQALPEYTIDQHALVDLWLAQVEEPRIRQTIHHLSTAWNNRYYQSTHGRDSAEWIRDTWLALGNGRGDVSAELFDCGACGLQPSVILTVEGNELADEVVVLGGHLDSISSTGWGDAMVAPGADDDASGIAVLTEIIRIALADGWRPKRTLKFMGYAAEEVGLRGSRAIAESFQAAGVNVVGVLQLDMTNYTTGTTLDMRLVTDFSNGPLKTFVGQLFAEYLAPEGLYLGTTSCGYACSDHASWTYTGYPSAFVIEPVLFPTRHTPTDTLENVGPTADTSVAFAKLGLAFVAELGKMGTRVGPLPFCPAMPDGTATAPLWQPHPVGAASAAKPFARSSPLKRLLQRLRE